MSDHNYDNKMHSIIVSFSEIPRVPKNLIYYDPNNSCDGTPRAKVKWDHPENWNTGFKLSHYVYIYNGTNKLIKRFVNESFTLNRSPSKAYNFEVYAVDKCGQVGERANITIPASNYN